MTALPVPMLPLLLSANAGVRIERASACRVQPAALRYLSSERHRTKAVGTVTDLEVQGVRRQLRLLPDQRRVGVPLWYDKGLRDFEQRSSLS